MVAVMMTPVVMIVLMVVLAVVEVVMIDATAGNDNDCWQDDSHCNYVGLDASIFWCVCVCMCVCL